MLRLHSGFEQPFIGDTAVPVKPAFNATCAKGSYIISWQLAALHTNLKIAGPAGSIVNTFLGYISAKCSNGLQLQTSATSTLNYDQSCGKAKADLDNVQHVDDDEGFTSIDYR